MFRFFQRRPPLSTAQRVDLEILVRRTLAVFGTPIVDPSGTLLGTREIRFDRSSRAASLQSVAESIADRFTVDPQNLRWKMAQPPALGEEASGQEASGDHAEEAFTFEPSDDDRLTVVSVNPLAVEDDGRMVMLVAAVLSHQAWQSHARRPLDTDVRTTSLFPIMVGLGIIASDASLYDDQWSTAGWSGWSLSQSGHYSPMEIGYAMALVHRVGCPSVTHRQRTPSPAWLGHLRLDSRDVAKSALRYFEDLDAKGRPLLLDARQIPADDQDDDQLASWLRSGDPSFSLYAARLLSLRESVNDGVIEAAGEAIKRGAQEGERDLVTQAQILVDRALIDKADR